MATDVQNATSHPLRLENGFTSSEGRSLEAMSGVRCGCDTDGWVGFVDSLDDLQMLAHYFTGPLVPNTRTNYCPAQA